MDSSSPRADLDAALKRLKAFSKETDIYDISAKKQEILFLFMRLAASRGYSSVSMRTLGDALHIKAPSLYSHFPGGKEEIVARCLRMQSTAYCVGLVAATANEENPDLMFERVCRYHCIEQLKNPDHNWWDMILDSDRVGQFLPADVRQEMHARVAVLEEIYEHLIACMAQKNARIKSKAIMSLVDSVGKWGRSEEGRAHDDIADMVHGMARSIALSS